MTADKTIITKGTRVPPYVQQLWLWLIASLIHYFIVGQSWFPAVEMEWGLVALFVFTLATAVSAYLALAGMRYHTGFGAVALMTSTVDTVGMLIATLEDDKKQRVLQDFKALLEAIKTTLQTMGQEAEYDAALAAFRKSLTEADLMGALVNGNGAMNRFMLARAQMKSTVSVRMSHSIKGACIVMLVLTAICLSLYLRNSELVLWLQAAAFGGFCYAVRVMIAVANDLGHPFDGGRSRVDLDNRFRTFGRRLKELSK